jgi:hypothetical protein
MWPSTSVHLGQLRAAVVRREVFITEAGNSSGIQTKTNVCNWKSL